MTANEYSNLSKQGKAAEAIIRGTLRGGFVLNGTFYAHAGSRGIVSAPVREVASLKFFR